MSSNKIILVLLTILLCRSLSAQIPVQDKIENLVNNEQATEEQLSQMAIGLETLKEETISINFSNMDELSQIPFLDIFQIHNLLQYRKKTGLIFSKYELLQIKGLDRQLIKELLPYINFDTRAKLPQIDFIRLKKYTRHEFVFRHIHNFQEREAFTVSDSNSYLGIPHDFLFRYRATFSKFISASFNMQQDAGESFKTNGVDFSSASISLKNFSFIKNLTVGDFQAEFGQGLNLWSGIGFGKSPNVTQIKRFARGIRPYSGTEENQFLRGIATCMRFGKVELSTFYSKRSLDARLQSSSDGNLEIKSLQNTGLHRNLSELQGKDATKLRLLGSHIRYRGDPFNLGVTYTNFELLHPLSAGQRLYQKFNLSDKNSQKLSLNANYIFRNLNLFGEWAINQNSAMAGIIGFQSRPDDGVELSILYRNFSKRFNGFYQSGFSEKGTSGEKGIYTGLGIELNPNLSLRSYLDLYHFNWPTYSSILPSKGYEFLTQLDYQSGRYFSVYIRFKFKAEEKNLNYDQTLPELNTHKRGSFRIHFSYRVSNSLRLSNRVELSKYPTIKEQGQLLFQDIRYTFQHKPITLICRYAIMNSNSFNSRIYAYENDLRYTFSIPAYYGKSQRLYVLLNSEISRHFIFQAKYGLTLFEDIDQIGSGLNAIEGNRSSQLKVQLILKL